MSQAKKPTKKKSSRPVRKKTSTPQTASPPPPTKDVDSDSADEHQDSSEEGLESNVNAGSDRAGKGVSTVPVDELKSTQENQFLMSLAAQLTASEMQAKRQEELIGGALRVILQMFAEMLKLNLSQAGTDPKYVESTVKRIAGYLHLNTSTRFNSNRPPKSHDEHHDLFHSFYRFAKDACGNFDKQQSHVYVEQIFKIDDVCTETDIYDRLKKHKWKNLKSKAPVRNLLGDINKWFSELGKHWLDFDLRPDVTRMQEKTRLVKQLQHLVSETKKILPEPHGDFDDEVNKIESFCRSVESRLKQSISVPPIFSRAYPKGRGSDDRALFDFITGAQKNKLSARERDKNNNPVRRYRPYAMFRYLRLYGESKIETPLDGRSDVKMKIDKLINAAKSINSRLCIMRKILNPEPEAMAAIEDLQPDGTGMEMVEELSEFYEFTAL